MGNFIDQLDKAIDRNNSLLCIGLDSDIGKLPAQFKNCRQPQLEFNKAIIEATAPFVSSYKINSAFYEATGADGIAQLKLTMDYLKQHYPNLPVILDAKRADIGNTNGGYIDFAFKYLKADAITLHPYLGGEALQPFLNLKDKGMIILCRTSNPGSGQFQDLIVDGQPVYQAVAHQVVSSWNTNGNCMLVVGATYPQEMASIRRIVGPDMPLLVPGIGAQGGDLEPVMAAGLGAGRRGLIIHSARGIIFASSGSDFAEVAAQKATELRDQINQLRK
ncbi:MAG: orotidine-5'-phosphate decarboxylase [Candidatus Saccharimonadales bacterium]